MHTTPLAGLDRTRFRTTLLSPQRKRSIKVATHHLSLSTLSSASSPTKQSQVKPTKSKPSASKLKQLKSKLKATMGAAQSLTIHGSFGVRTAFKAPEVIASGSASISTTSLVATRPTPPPTSHQQENQDDSNASSSRQRSPSPTPTEPCVELTQEECVDALKAMGIKVRDYAYAPRKPATSTASSSEPTTATSNPAPTSAPQAEPEAAMTQPEKDELRPPTAALWSPDSALAEYDVRVASVKRTYPITGRTLSRLLEIGWVTEEQALEDCHEMDWEAMYKYRELCLKRSTTERWQDGEYPWKFLWTRGADRGKPDMKTRMILMDSERRMRAYVDRACNDELESRARAQRDREEEEKDAAIIRRMRENGELWEVDLGGYDHRAVDDAEVDADDIEMIAPEVGKNKRLSPDSFDEDEEEQVEKSPRRRNAKRRRISPTPLAVVPTLPPQYPAPLHSYHPEIRHQVRAAKEFASSKPASSSQHSSSQSQHNSQHHHSRSQSQSSQSRERSDTPPPGCDATPSTSRATTPVAEEPKPKSRILGKRLSRTTTFTQIL
ncbi:hypothetical protein AB1N83_013529 [Pleurotus pulmonarius]